MESTLNPTTSNAGTRITKSYERSLTVERRAPLAYQVLHVGYVAIPLIAGADKFFSVLTHWDKYLAPIVPRLTGLTAPGFMKIVGAIEIAAAVGVIFKPKLFGYVVSAWLVGIIINLLILCGYYDVALRDLGLSVGAFVLALLSQDQEQRQY